ncbi:hypothetical protein [Zunongwangia endophytica]|uniref:Uncharacterized protein n=1 Tax=Zunongwangia endophytica TaxID=1808945 RepID=A0ABV8HFT1_9FLAO|nr:hypothetical protein [Zunongwangia endophytica]MDN3596785.1 hypothetical protein [Zunongwangia endophytica]
MQYCSIKEKALNKTRFIPFLAILFLNFSPLTSFSQGTIVLDKIEEFRYIDARKNLLRIELKAKDFEADWDHFLRVENIGTVKDDTGTILSPHENYPYKGQWSGNSLFKLNFFAPSREATKLTEISTVVSYFTISEEKKSLLQINNITNKKDTDLLSKLDVDTKLILIDFQKLKTLKDQPGFEDYIKELYKEVGIGDSLEEARKFVDQLFYFSYDEVGRQLFFYKKDPEDKIFKLNVYNAEGEKINTGYSYTGEKIVLHLSEKVTSECRLEVKYEHPDAIEEIKLELKNIPLP